MLYAGLDIHKAVFQVVVLDPDSGELRECRFEPVGADNPDSRRWRSEPGQRRCAMSAWGPAAALSSFRVSSLLRFCGCD